MEDPFGADSITCMEDVMNGFLDTVDLNQLDSVELGELTNSLLESTMDCMETISDSDSGISVGGEKKMLTSDVNLIDDATSFRGRSPFLISPESDCLLTNAVEQPPPACSGMLPSSKEPNKGHQRNTPASLPNPIRIIKITNGAMGNRRQPQGPESQSVIFQKTVPVKGIGTTVGSVPPSNSVNGVLNILPPKTKAVKVSQVHGLGDSVPSGMNMLKLTPISNAGDSGLRPLSDSSETVTFLDEYDPVAYADASLEKHLNTSSALNRFQSGGLPIRIPEYSGLPSPSPAYLSPSDQFGSRDCLLTRAHLDRIRKKQERMIKNRHAASMSRLRKKEYLERLEMRYEQLKRENHQLWRQNEEWRVRCLQLEQALNDIQSKISDYEDSADAADPETATTKGANVNPTSESASSVKDINFQPNARDPVTSSNSAIRSVSITYPSPPTTVFSTVSRSNSRTGLCALYTKSGVTSDEGASKWTLDSTKLISKSAPQTVERDKQPRKTVINSVIYPGKNAPASTTSLSTRPKLISFGGIISRHRTSNFHPASRPKLIATTSLLTMFCLFSLNILTLPISSGNGGPGSSVQAMQGWSHLRSHPFGRRVLLSVRENTDNEQWDVKTRGVKCKFPNDVDGCLEIPSDSAEFNATEPVHLLLGWIEEHEAFRIGTSALNQDDRVRKGEALQRSLPLTTIRDTKENRSRYLSFTKPRNRRVTSGSSSTPSTHFGASSDRQMSRSLSGKVLPAYDPIPSTKESNFASVSERAVQPFHPRTWDSDELVNAAGRQNGTVYVILTQLDHVQLEAVNPTYHNATRKITFIVPAHPLQVAANRQHGPIGFDTRPSMLQVDCELINVSLIAPFEASKNSTSDT